MPSLKINLPNNIIAVAIYPFILINKKEDVDDSTINHEKIHLRQQAELLILPFYLWYGLEYLIRLVTYKDSDTAYRNISFEKEAFENEHNQEYLRTRKFLSFLKYI